MIKQFRNFILFFGLIIFSSLCFGSKHYGVTLHKGINRWEVKRTIGGRGFYAGSFDYEELKRAKHVSDDLVFDHVKNGKEIKNNLNFPQEERWEFLRQEKLHALPKEEIPTEVKYGKAAYYDQNRNFIGFFPITAVEKSPNPQNDFTQTYVVNWKSGHSYDKLKVQEQLLEQKHCKLEIGDLVRLENDIGLIIDKMQPETEEDLYNIQWLEDGRAVSVKPEEIIVLLQKAYAKPELIQKRYERGKVSKLEPEELKKYKLAVYHEYGEILDFFPITAVEYDGATDMYRVSWEDGEEWDSLKSLEELHQTEPTQSAKDQPLWKKLEALDPQVQTPAPTENLKRKRPEKTPRGERKYTTQEKIPRDEREYTRQEKTPRDDHERDYTRQRQTQWHLGTMYTPPKQKRALYVSLAARTIAERRLKKRKEKKKDKNEKIQFLAQVRQCRYRYNVQKMVFDKDEDGYFTIRKPINDLVPVDTTKMQMAPIISNKLNDPLSENVYFRAENLNEYQKPSSEEMQQQHISFRKK